MDGFINKKLWKSEIKGWLITKCVMRSRNIIALMSREETPMDEASVMYDSEIPTRLYVIFMDNKDLPMGSNEYENIDFPSLGVSRKPIEQSLLSSGNIDGQVFARGSGKGGEEFINKGKYPAHKLKCVLDYCYAVGVCREVYKRVDIGNWVSLDKGIEKNDSSAFNDIDAFTETDIYAVGGDGEVWHFDGECWSQCGFPSNEKLNTVVCAPDGNVYIGGKAGNIWKGRVNKWDKVYTGDFTVLWNEMRWFQDKLWVVSDYMLRIFEDGELIVPRDEQDNEIVLEGHMDVYEDMMVIAGLYHAHTFDGKTLRTIVAPYE